MSRQLTCADHQHPITQLLADKESQDLEGSLEPEGSHDYENLLESRGIGSLEETQDLLAKTIVEVRKLAAHHVVEEQDARSLGPRVLQSNVQLRDRECMRQQSPSRCLTSAHLVHHALQRQVVTRSQG